MTTKFTVFTYCFMIASGLLRGEDNIVTGEVKMNDSAKTFNINNQKFTANSGTLNVKVKFHDDIGIDKRFTERKIMKFKLAGFGTCSLNLNGYPGKSRRELLTLWLSDILNKHFSGNWYRNYFMSFNKDQIYTFSYSWNGEKGIFESFLNNYPMTKFEGSPWTTDAFTIRKITFSKGNYSIVEVNTKPLSHSRNNVPVPEAIGQNHEDTPLSTADGEIIYSAEMDRPEDIKGWVMEGPGKTLFKDGWMEIHTPQPDASGFKGHHTFWCPQQLPDNYRIDWDFKTLNNQGLAIIFIDALGLNGKDIMDKSLAKRDGDFRQYWKGDIRNYHFSYYDGGEWIRANKNPYKCMFAIGKRPRYKTGQVYHITIIKQSNTIQLGIDGKLIFKVKDKSELFGKSHHKGKMALRQMRPAITAVRNFTIKKLP